ncbi:glycosyltransferase family 2 protein [Desulfocurvibacter africanus]|uniref:Glycosyl transferase family 2 n=1 Tax=Desulfocurvibacter africanus subsp. africanus str. Walvis Bay TaxID=690850 RepID=F3Z3N3_DESAF|nr:glycosyltransferase family 2 protein [Desulfocurvibacter africanus]EGJ50405.1 glycosyl transferase family 2 [Desulfocurvibacter africanus subsp. africanus str. Walvis Bay]
MKEPINPAGYVSIIVPVRNEEENLVPLLAEIEAAAAGLDKPWEVIFVDDGSTDNSLDVIRGLARGKPHVRYLSFACNCGQSAAFKAGFDVARGDVLVTMDADLQNDPADISAMLALYEAGDDMVIGWRACRRDSLAKRWGSLMANRVRNSFTRESVRDTGCSLKVMRASMARRMPMFTGMHRFLPTLMKLQGAKVAEVPVNHRPRRYGVSKYGNWERLRAGLLDLVAVRWMQSRWFTYDIKESK